MLREIVEGVKDLKVVFPFPGVKLADMKEAGIQYSVTVDKIWDKANPDDYRLFGSKKDIKKFLNMIGFKDYIDQI